jgi:hypothetical protein
MFSFSSIFAIGTMDSAVEKVGDLPPVGRSPLCNPLRLPTCQPEMSVSAGSFSTLIPVVALACSIC